MDENNSKSNQEVNEIRWRWSAAPRLSINTTPPRPPVERLDPPLSSFSQSFFLSSLRTKSIHLHAIQQSNKSLLLRVFWVSEISDQFQIHSLFLVFEIDSLMGACPFILWGLRIHCLPLMESIWSQNVVPAPSRFIFAVYFAFASFGARVLLDRYVYQVRFTCYLTEFEFSFTDFMIRCIRMHWRLSSFSILASTLRSLGFG